MQCISFESYLAKLLYLAAKKIDGASCPNVTRDRLRYFCIFHKEISRVFDTKACKLLALLLRHFRLVVSFQIMEQASRER